MITILGYSNIRDLCRLDIAMTNNATRAIWLSALRQRLNHHKHSHKSIRWLVEKGISPEYLQTSGDKVISNRINGRTLVGLDMSSLRSISLISCDIADKEVISIAHGCPNLTEITLFDCCGVKDESMRALAGRCRELNFIDVRECNKISDEGLRAYAAACSVSDAANLAEKGYGSALRGISLSNNKRITDEGIIDLGISCRLMSNISLSDCTNITDRGISALGDCCHFLDRICLSGCYKISDVGISALGRCCPKLTDIDLSGCNRITDIGISDLAECCRSLRKFTLSDCFKITDGSLSAIGRACRSLREISLSKCNRITNTGT